MVADGSLEAHEAASPWSESTSSYIPEQDMIVNATRLLV
jgi:hypothetical protein